MYDDHVQIVLCVLGFCCVGFAVVRLKISCCLWYYVMHILCVSFDTFDFFVLYFGVAGVRLRNPVPPPLHTVAVK